MSGPLNPTIDADFPPSVPRPVKVTLGKVLDGLGCQVSGWLYLGAWSGLIGQIFLDVLEVQLLVHVADHVVLLARVLVVLLVDVRTAGCFVRVVVLDGRVEADRPEVNGTKASYSEAAIRCVDRRECRAAEN